MVECRRCGGKWEPRVDRRPKQCPTCKSPRWDEERRAVGRPRNGGVLGEGLRLGFMEDGLGIFNFRQGRAGQGTLLDPIMERSPEMWLAGT